VLLDSRKIDTNQQVLVPVPHRTKTPTQALEGSANYNGTECVTLNISMSARLCGGANAFIGHCEDNTWQAQWRSFDNSG
jgi:hypothetical protein